MANITPVLRFFDLPRTTEFYIDWLDPENYEEALEKQGCREMDFNGKPMKGYVFVDEHGLSKKADFSYWIGLCLEFNPKAKSSKKKK